MPYLIISQIKNLKKLNNLKIIPYYSLIKLFSENKYDFPFLNSCSSVYYCVHNNKNEPKSNQSF